MVDLGGRLRQLPWPVQVLVLAAAHYTAARLGLTFGRLDSIVAPVWPPSGVALAGLWLFGLRAWPGVALSAFAVDLGADVALPSVLGMVAGTTLESVVAVALLRRAGFRPALDRLRDVAALVVLGGIVACALGAAVGAASLVADEGATGAFAETWRVWWLGDVLGLLVVGTVLLGLSTDRARRTTRPATPVLVAAAAAVVAVAGFGPEPVPPYILLPFISLVAARYGTVGVTEAAVVVAVTGVVRTSAGAGPFAEADAVQSLYQLDGFLAMLSLSGLALAAVVSERDRAHESLRLAHQRLEARIEERTEELIRDRERLAEAQRIAHVGSWEWDVDADVVRASDELYRIYGMEPTDDPGRSGTYLDRVHPDDRPAMEEALRRSIAERLPYASDHRVVLADGTERWVRGTGQVLDRDDERPLRLVGTSQDITERRQTEERFRNLLDAAPDAMVIVGPDGRLDLVNRQTEALLGYTREELIGQPVELLLPERYHAAHHAHRDGYFTSPRTRPMGDGAELYARRKDGSEVPVEVSLSPLHTERGVVVSAAIRDATSRRLAEEQLAHQALHDSLTGLPNRTLLADRLDQAVARAARTGNGVAVLFLDLDRFKLVNDSLGHAAGDVVLVAVADRLRSTIRATDTVARFGGDEFVVVCEDTDEAPSLADRLLRAMHQPFGVEGEELFLSASIGVAVVSGEAHSADAILRDADAAMYRAKERGRSRIECFDETMRTEAAAKLESHGALHRALDRGELRVFYQPIVDLRTERVERIEALVRWQHPERGLVGPGDFIPEAEESGLIVPLGAFVLEEAVRQHAGWQGRHPGLGLGVNLSARQLRHPDLVSSIAATLRSAGVEPATLSLELTESVLMEDLDSLRTTLRALRDLGIRLSIDDFGTGYSSLTYLRRFPVDTVKIDQTFVQGVASDPADRAIVESVIDLAHALGMRVVAEGVEQATQVRLLRRLGCDLAQGHYFEAAQPAEEIDAVLARTAAAPAPTRRSRRAS